MKQDLSWGHSQCVEPFGQHRLHLGLGGLELADSSSATASKTAEFPKPAPEALIDWNTDSRAVSVTALKSHVLAMMALPHAKLSCLNTKSRGRAVKIHRDGKIRVASEVSEEESEKRSM